MKAAAAAAAILPPQRVTGTIHSSCRGRYRIAFLQCSCMIVSTFLRLPTASGFWSSSSIAPSTRQQAHSSTSTTCRSSLSKELSLFSTRRKRITTTTRENWNYYDGRRCFGTSALDNCITQRPQHRLALQSCTRLFMSTSMPSGGWNVSESSMWDNEDDGYENDGDENDDNDDGNDETESADEIDSSALLEDHRTWTKAVEKAVRALEKKRKSLRSELTKAEGAESTAAYAQLLVSNMYMFQDGVTTATVNDWENGGKEVELTLDATGKYHSASAEADALFSLVRKLKRGSKIVVTLLEETDAAWELLNEVSLDLQSACGGGIDTTTDSIDEGRLMIVRERLIRTSRTTNFQVPTANDNSGSSNSGGNNNSNGSKRGGQNGKHRKERKPELGTPASNVRKLMSPAGCIVLVGRNRRGNEYLSMTAARGNDIWMHSRGCPGAHVIIQNRRGSPTVTDECLQFGADLAIFYSDLRNENKAEVTAAEPKHVQKPRGAPLGAVKLREEWKTFVGRPDRVPEVLKQAREESGQTDEYHMLDKAKHRRRTKQVAEDDRAKKRQRQREKKNQNS